jgi:TPR repeat protein
VEWFRKAADQGHAGAQFNLGNEYKRGVGLTQDNSKATHWWRKAAQKGLLQAQHNIGMAYYFGSGIKQDRNKAMFWFRTAADSHYEPAMLLVKQLQEEAKQTAKDHKPKLVANSPQKKPPTVTSTSPVSREKWILAQPENNYTIQLFGSGNEEQVINYINTHQLAGKVAFFNVVREGNPWYSVIYGSFNDIQRARTKGDTYGAIFKNSPWVRQFKGIQDMIKNTY